MRLSEILGFRHVIVSLENRHIRPNSFFQLPKCKCSHLNNSSFLFREIVIENRIPLLDSKAFYFYLLNLSQNYHRAWHHLKVLTEQGEVIYISLLVQKQAKKVWGGVYLFKPNDQVQGLPFIQYSFFEILLLAEKRGSTVNCRCTSY